LIDKTEDEPDVLIMQDHVLEQAHEVDAMIATTPS
jgi:hypothetical protein